MGDTILAFVGKKKRSSSFGLGAPEGKIVLVKELSPEEQDLSWRKERLL